MAPQEKVEMTPLVSDGKLMKETEVEAKKEIEYCEWSGVVE